MQTSDSVFVSWGDGGPDAVMHTYWLVLVATGAFLVGAAAVASFAVMLARRYNLV